MSEHDEQCAVFDVLRLNERKHSFLRFVYAVPNGSLRHLAVARKLQREGVKAGIADICIPIPKISKQVLYHGAYIEMKVKPNKLTNAQKEFSDFVIQHGYYFETCWSADGALDVIEKYLDIKLSR